MRAVCNIRPQKTESHRTRLTAGGNLIYYPREVSTPTSDFKTITIHVKSAISDIKSRYMCMNIKYLYLSNHMDRDEYIMIQLSMIPQEFVEIYNLAEKAHNGYIYASATKGIYGPPPSRTDST